MAETRTRRARPRSSRRTTRSNGTRSQTRAAAARGGTTANGGPVEAVSHAASKAKGPAIAAGAAVAAAAVAGGVAIARHNGRGKKRGGLSMPDVSLPKLHKPSGDTTRDALKATAKALGGAAVEVGKAGYRVGELTSEVRRVREQASHQD